MVEGDHPSLEFDSIEGNRKTAQRLLVEFKEKTGTEFIVGISGGSSNEQSSQNAQILFDLLLNLKDLHVAVLSGGTKGGIPEATVTFSKRLGIPNIGLYPQNGKKYVMFDSVDLAIESYPPLIGEANFGSETPCFAQIPDFLVVIGGSEGTFIEVATILKANTRIKEGKKLKYVIPISGTGGVADFLKIFAEYFPKAKTSLPDYEITNGVQAAEYIKRLLK